MVSSLLRDRQLRAIVALSALVGFDLIDWLSYTFAPPGFFRLFFIRLTVVGAIAGAVVFGWLLYRKQKRVEAIAAALPPFVARRTEALRQAVDEDPEYQTFCFDCRHFDADLRGCRLHLYDRQMRIVLERGSSHSYCLYWNVSEPAELLRTVRLLD